MTIYSQGGWEAAPQGPSALMPHNLGKGILTKPAAAQRGKKTDMNKACDGLAQPLPTALRRASQLYTRPPIWF